ncbi:hypothetical protein F5X97DRAFT_40678 [Nemania serpens]|nr:hypothetical protein F5X97DRAFT_40678 [Nemania serpens]
MASSTSTPGSPPPTTGTTTVHLQATYTSPRTRDSQLLYSVPLAVPTAVDQSLEEKTSYLRALRAATIALQDRINTELTARMDEDARETPSAGRANGEMAGKASGKTAQASAAAVDEVAEEENYGEEVAEEEDEV